jgi:hypothetical protein
VQIEQLKTNPQAPAFDASTFEQSEKEISKLRLDLVLKKDVQV